MRGTAVVVSLILLDGDPDGLRIARIQGHSIEAIAFNCQLFKQILKSHPEKLARPGVYILYGEGNDQDAIAYIGESDNVGARLGHYVSTDVAQGKKTYWKDTIILTRNDGTLNKAHVRFVESKLISEAEKNPYWKLANDQLVNKGKPKVIKQVKLSEEDEITMSSFIKEAHILIGTLGCSLLRLPPVVQPKEDQPEVYGPEFRFSGKGFDARAIQSKKTGQWIVQKGSVAKASETATLAVGVKKLREQMKSKGQLISNDIGMVFQDDSQFSSPSTAASFVCGSPTNGYIAWRLSDGSTLKDSVAQSPALSQKLGQ
jgi:hypothetical protein